MNRSQLLWLLSWIALSGAVFWLLPHHLPYAKFVVAGSFFWAVLAFASIWIEALEDWAYRFSSFFGFMLCTVEGILGLLALTPKKGLLLLATLHGMSFIIAVAGRYQSRVRRRPKRNFEDIAQEVVQKSQESDSKPAQSTDSAGA